MSRLPQAASHCGLAADEARGVLWVVGGWAGGRSLRATHCFWPKDALWTEGPPLGTGEGAVGAGAPPGARPD